jgi:hypothetical protein
VGVGGSDLSAENQAGDHGVAGSAWPNFSPQSPRALHSTGLRLGSFEDLQPDAVIQFHPRGVENRADGSGHTALPANDFTEIARRNLQLQNCNVLAFYYSDGDRFRDVNESFSDIFDQLFHAPRLLYSTFILVVLSAPTSMIPRRLLRLFVRPGGARVTGRRGNGRSDRGGGSYL